MSFSIAENSSIPLEARMHPFFTLLDEFFKIIIRLSKFCTFSWQCHKIVKMPTLKQNFIWIWNFKIFKTCETRNVTQGKYYSFFFSFHHCKGDFRSHSLTTMCWYNDNSFFTKKILLNGCSNKESSMLEVDRVGLLALDP